MALEVLARSHFVALVETEIERQKNDRLSGRVLVVRRRWWTSTFNKKTNVCVCVCVCVRER